jgi:hypothetical protein
MSEDDVEQNVKIWPYFALYMLFRNKNKCHLNPIIHGYKSLDNQA